MDMSNAFLHGELYETVYMKPPKGYSGLGGCVSVNMELPQVSSSIVCKLRKSLYGLRQASRLWFAKLSIRLLEMGYQQSKTDYSLFSKHTAASITLILVYVDDLLLCGSCLKSINDISNLSWHIASK